MTTRPVETPPPLWLQLVSLSLIFALGIAAGWIVWGRAPKASNGATRGLAEPEPRRIALGSGESRANPSATRGAPSPSLNRIFQALTIVDADARFVELLAALGEMKAEDALAVQERLKEDFRPDKGPNREREALYRRWGEVDPAGAIAIAKTLGDEKAQGYVLKLMIEGWARKDPAAAAQWLDGWPSAPDWEGVCAGLIKGIAARDPWMAAQTAVASTPEASDVKTNWLRDAVVSTLAEAMMRRGGSEELQRWFASIPSGTPAELKFKQKAMHTVALHLEHRDPAAMKRWLETQPPAPWLSVPAYALAARRLARADPAASLDWLAALPGDAPSVRGQAGKDVYKEWLAEKPDEASQWVRTMTQEAFLREIGAANREGRSATTGTPPK
jgi:hypothetical protein